MITPQLPVQDLINDNLTSEVQAADAFNTNAKTAVKEIILRHLIESILKKNDKAGVTSGVTIMDLQDQRTLVGRNQDTEHFAASINKIPVALLVLEDLRAGTLDLDQMMTWQASDRRAGFGVYDQPGSPLQAPLRDVLFDMLNQSGNTAVRILVNYGLDGSAAVNARFAAKPQLPHTYLIPLDANRFFLGNSTTHDSLWAMDQLLKTQDEPGAFIKNALVTNIFTDFGVRSQLAGNDYIVLANKIGLLDDVDGNNRHDVGIIYNTKTNKSYGYSFFTTSPFDSPAATPQADQSLKDMGRTLLRFSGDRVQEMAEPFMSQRSQYTPESKILY
ncbi:MAG TPA: serine hydrolase [Candidatus Saccharimonadales bacterium]|nr:serine hydrolase [Candidatus Saccharimonadales bacterium]